MNSLYEEKRKKKKKERKMNGMWTRSIRSESRYVRCGVLALVRYGVITMSNEDKIKVSFVNEVNETKTESETGERNVKGDQSKHVYTRSILRCRIGVTIRRTKLEVYGSVTEEYRSRRSGKIRITYATENVKLIRLRATLGSRRVSQNRSKISGRIEAYEYPILIMLATRGLIVLVNVNDRVGMYVAVEWMSLCMYVMAAFRRGSAYSTEAGLKYYVVGAFGSAWILLGISMMYGWRGTLNRVEIERRRVRGTSSTTREMGLLYRRGWMFVRGALMLKLGGVPMHRWLADVYEGAPRSSVLYFAVVPKIALFRVMIRRVSVWYVQSDERSTGVEIYEIMSARTPITSRRIAVSVRSMGVGAIGALTQRRRKRFRAYSAIGHTGYILLGVRRGTVEGVQGVLVYSIIYMIITIVMWQRRMIVKIYKVNGSDSNVKVRDVKYRTDRYQLGKENPVLGLRVARTCMSMAGVPPIAGFGAKMSVFRALISSSYYRLGTRAVRLSVIGAFNYVRIVKRMFFEENVNRDVKNEEISVMANKEVSRRRAIEGRFRGRLRLHPSSLLLRTHRIALEVIGR